MCLLEALNAIKMGFVNLKPDIVHFRKQKHLANLIWNRPRFGVKYALFESQPASVQRQIIMVSGIYIYIYLYIQGFVSI